MKKVFLVSIFFLLFACSSVDAQNLKGTFAISGRTGAGIPLGDFADENKGAAKANLGFGGCAEYFVTDNLSIGGIINYQTFGVATEDIENDAEAIIFAETGELFEVDVDAKEKITSFGAFLRYLIPTRTRTYPFLKFGIGAGKFGLSGDADYHHIASGMTFNADMDGSFDSKLYIDLGAGFLSMLSSNIAFTGEVLYTNVMTDNADGEMKVSMYGESFEEDTELDFNSSYFSIYGGLTFFLGGSKY